MVSRVVFLIFMSFCQVEIGQHWPHIPAYQPLLDLVGSLDLGLAQYRKFV